MVDVSGFDLSSIPLFITIPQLQETVIRTQLASGRELPPHPAPASRSGARGNRPAVGLQGEASCKDQNRRSKFKPRLEALGARGLWALGWLPSRGPFPRRGPPPCSLPTSRSGNCFVSGSENRFPPKEILSHRGEAGSGLEFPAVEKPGLRSRSERGHALRRTQTGTETETERPGNPPGTLRSRFWVLVPAPSAPPCVKAQPTLSLKSPFCHLGGVKTDLLKMQVEQNSKESA